jgi:hypothetical protein
MTRLLRKKIYPGASITIRYPKYSHRSNIHTRPHRPKFYLSRPSHCIPFQHLDLRSRWEEAIPTHLSLSRQKIAIVTVADMYYAFFSAEIKVSVHSISSQGRCWHPYNCCTVPLRLPSHGYQHRRLRAKLQHWVEVLHRCALRRITRGRLPAHRPRLQ